MEKSSARVVIATASDGGFLPAACCQLRSASLHLASKKNVQLFLVVCDVGQTDLGEARRFFCERGLDVSIVVADEIADRIRPVSKRWPRAAYLRLYFDHIFGNDIERLVYFDADTRICAPLDPLLTVALHGAPCGAVHDFIYYTSGNIRRRRNDLFLAADAPYLQSGVMVFDWPATLADGGLERARQFLDKYPERCQEAPDQDALNAAFEGKWTPIDPRWNLHELYLTFRGKLTPYVEHYTTNKPWSRNRPPVWREAAAWYQQELAGTAWADFIAPQSVADVLQAHATYLKSRFFPHVRDSLTRYAPFVLDLMGKPHHRSDSKELPWAPKFARDVEDMAQVLVVEAERRCPRLLPPEVALGRPIGWGPIAGSGSQDSPISA